MKIVSETLNIKHCVVVSWLCGVYSLDLEAILFASSNRGLCSFAGRRVTYIFAIFDMKGSS